MIGIVFYAAVAAGLGGLWPLALRSGMGTTGLRFALGYATMTVAVYAAHVLSDVPLKATVAGLAVGAIAGFVLMARRRQSGSGWRAPLGHPALVLVLLGAAAVLLNGGIGYLPFTHDEFSHWLATPRLLHLSGSWADIEAALHLRYYTPGWQLALLLPWQISGQEDFGMSAAAPFILHVTVIALIYDLVVFQIRQRLAPSPRLPGIAALAGWAFVLLFLAAEAMGRLWTYTLLIEQPQIYSYATVLLLIYAAESTGRDRRPLYAAAGFILASAYLYKVAALMFVPAVIGLAGLALFERARRLPDRVRNAALTAALLAGPILVATVSWSLAVQSDHCSLFSLSADQLARAASLDWKDLAVRFATAVADYVTSYKLVLTLAAGIGVAAALRAGKYRAVLVLALASAAYFMLLYLYHLTCFGPYYFQHLNSIERFTRVPLQAFHALGLVMLFEFALGIAARKTPLRTGGPWLAAMLAVGVIGLIGWQGRQVSRSVVDMTVRSYQGIDPRIAEMRLAAARIESLKTEDPRAENNRGALPAKPVLTIISQGQDNAVVSYAMFFGLNYENGRIDPRFTVTHRVSWSPAPGNHGQSRAATDQVVEQLAGADIVWPVTLDAWLMTALARLVPDPACLNALPGKALIRDRTTDPAAAVRFACIPKELP